MYYKNDLDLTRDTMITMRGLYYNLTFIKPTREEIQFQKLLMADIVSQLERSIKEEYKFEFKVTTNMVFNLVHRPEKSNRIVRQFAKVSAITA